jgi:hypothetical protein
MNVTLNRDEISQAILVYMYIKGYSVKGDMRVSCRNNDIQEIIISNVVPYEVDMEKLKMVIRKG